jgi:DNA-binding MarR family transcriptional regulator
VFKQDLAAPDGVVQDRVAPDGLAPDRERELTMAWRELLACHATVSCELERALHDHGLGVSDFEVLDRLADTEAGSQRMQDLADAVHLSQSALSRLVSRLERDGLVSRTMCSDDRRCIYVELTEVGQRRHAAARPIQRAVLAARLPR